MSISIGDAVLKMGLDKADFDNSMKSMDEHIKSSMEKLQSGLRIGGVAFTALGAAGLKMASDARQINAQLGQTALTIGSTTKEMRDLTLAITNVTFPIKSVTATFDLLARAGMRNTDEMKKSANAFDALADATGSSAEVVADQLIPVFRAFGLELPSSSVDMDRFTNLVKNTTVNLSDFATVVQRLAPEMQLAGLTMDDAMIALTILEERGITGRASIQMLSEAIAEVAKNAKRAEDAQKGLADASSDLERINGDLQGATEDVARANENLLDVVNRLANAQEDAVMTMRTSAIALKRNELRIADLRKESEALGLTERDRIEINLSLQEAEINRENILKRMAEAEDRVAEAQKEVIRAQEEAVKLQEKVIGAEGEVEKATIKVADALKKTAEKGITFNKVLNISQEEIDGYTKQIEGATGITDKYASVANEQVGIMDKVRQKFEELTLSAGSFLTPLEPILALMTALGPIMLFFSTAMGISTVKTIAHTGALIVHKIALAAHKIALGAVTAAQWLWNTAMSANPIGLIIIAITALIAGIVLLVQHWDWVKEKTIEVWNNIKAVVGNAINWIIEQINKIPGINIPVTMATESAVATTALTPYARGGLISEPTLLYGLRSMKPYAIAGERGREVVSPVGGGGGDTNFYIDSLVVREEADVQRIARELERMRQSRMRTG